MHHLTENTEHVTLGEDIELQQARDIEQIQEHGAEIAQEAILVVEDASNVDEIVQSLDLSPQELEFAREFLGMNKGEWQTFLRSHLTSRMKDAASSMIIMNQLGAIVILVSMLATIRSECTPCENALRFSIVLLILSTLAFSAMYALAAIRDQQNNNQLD